MRSRNEEKTGSFDGERALAPSREKAKAYIMSGDVYVDGQKEDKAGTMFRRR